MTKSLEKMVENKNEKDAELKEEGSGFNTPVKNDEEKAESPIAAGKSTSKLTESDYQFIKVHCIDAIKLKWSDKSLIKKENIAVPQFVEA